MTEDISELMRELREPVMLHQNAEQTNAERRRAADALERLSAGTAVARAHITLEDDGIRADLEVLDGSLLQPEMSPVNLYAAPSSAENARLVSLMKPTPAEVDAWVETINDERDKKLAAAEARIAELSAENAELKMQAIADIGQAQSAYEAQLTAEARLAEAVEVIKQIAIVCADNSGQDVEHDLALRFVGNAADRFIGSVGEPQR